jgi:hypothetical protein
MRCFAADVCYLYLFFVETYNLLEVSLGQGKGMLKVEGIECRGFTRWSGCRRSVTYGDPCFQPGPC